MFNAVKVFIELHKDLIAKEDWKKLYQAVYDLRLPNYQVEELLHVFNTCGISTATDIRNELLFNTIVEKLKLVKQNRSDITKTVLDNRDRYVIQFLREYLYNFFGFTEQEVINMILSNETILGIRLISTNKSAGQQGLNNYMIHFVN